MAKNKKTIRPQITSAGLLGTMIVFGINLAFAMPIPKWPTVSSPTEIQITNISGQTELSPEIVKTSDNNFIISYVGFTGRDNSNLFVKKINAAGGTTIWSSQITSQSGLAPYSEYRLVADRDGGAYVIWDMCESSCASWDIYAQRLAGNSGNLLWADDGINLTADHSYMDTLSDAILDQSGGLYVSWYSQTSPYRSYLAHLSTTGTSIFSRKQIPQNPRTSTQDLPLLSSSDNNNVIVVYEEKGTSNGLYATKIRPEGDTAAWPTGLSLDTSIELSRAGNTLSDFQITSDNNFGATVGYIVTDQSQNYFVKGQHLVSNGTFPWGTTGTTLKSTSVTFFPYQIKTLVNDINESIFVWYENAGDPTFRDVYAQKLSETGSIQWPEDNPSENGIAVSNITDEFPQALDDITKDGQNGVIIALNSNNGTNEYIQRVTSTGELPWSTPERNGFALGLSSPGTDLYTRLTWDGEYGAATTWAGKETDNINSDIWAQLIEAQPVCLGLRDNSETGGQTISDQCLLLNVTGGPIYLANTPKSFSFPTKYTTSANYNQPSFSNFSGHTGPNGKTDPFGGTQQIANEDVLTVTDLRNAGGFQVTITAEKFLDDAEDEIPLKNLYVTTTYPTANDLPANPELLGATQQGITYALNSYGPKDISNTVDTTASITQQTTYKNFGRNFDQNNDTFAEPIVLMYTDSAHAGSFSNALNFYIDIPGAQPSGNYATLFTIDLTPAST